MNFGGASNKIVDFFEKINLPLFFLLRTFQVIIQVVLGFLAQGAM